MVRAEPEFYMSNQESSLVNALKIIEKKKVFIMKAIKLFPFKMLFILNSIYDIDIAIPPFYSFNFPDSPLPILFFTSQFLGSPF